MKEGDGLFCIIGPSAPNESWFRVDESPES